MFIHFRHRHDDFQFGKVHNMPDVDAKPFVDAGFAVVVQPADLKATLSQCSQEFVIVHQPKVKKAK